MSAQLHVSAIHPGGSGVARWVSWCGSLPVWPCWCPVSCPRLWSTPEWRNCIIFAPRPLLQPMARLTWLAEQEGLRTSGQRGDADRLQNYQVGPQSVEIRMIPGGLFVNISTENLQGLRALFAVGPRQPVCGCEWDESPMALARAVIEFRDGAGRRRGQSFHSPEDLLRAGREPRCL